MERVIFSGDPFRSDSGHADQIGNVMWLGGKLGRIFADLTRKPVEVRLPLIGETVANILALQDGALKPSLDSWARVFWSDAASPLVERVAAACAGALVVTIEMPPVLENALDRAGVPWIDIGVSPLRFMPDWALHLKTSSHFRMDAVRDDLLTGAEVNGYAKHVRDWYGAADVAEPTLVFFAQTLRDRTLIHEGRFLGPADVAAGLDELGLTRPLLIKPHPWQADSGVVRHLVEAGGAITGASTYALLSSPQVEVVTLSSSVGREARAFGRNATSLHPSVQDWAFSGVDVLRSAVSPRFWGTLLASAGIAVEAAEDAAWHPGMLRGSIPQQGLDPAVWGS